MNERVTIYGLCDDSGVRYVGQTRLAPEQRLRDHWARRKWECSAKAAWLCALEQEGRRPTVVALEVVERERADEAELRQIAAHRASGCALVNGMPGGPRPRQADAEGGKRHVLLTLPPALMDALRSEARERTLPPATAARQLILEQLGLLDARRAAAGQRDQESDDGRHDGYGA